MKSIVKVVDEPLRLDSVADLAAPHDGALVVFQGVVRSDSEDRKVEALIYEAHIEMAEGEMKRIAEEAAQRWPLNGICLLHRVGRLAVGEASVLVAVSSPHRREAFEAASFCIDTIKSNVAIWKKEIFEDGTGRWVGHA